MGDDRSQAEGAEKKEKKGPPGEEMAVGDDFYMVVKGKTFELLSGSCIIRLGHANAQLVDDWLDILRNTGTTMYQKSPIFMQQLLPVKVRAPRKTAACCCSGALVDGRYTSCYAYRYTYRYTYRGRCSPRRTRCSCRSKKLRASRLASPRSARSSR